MHGPAPTGHELVLAEPDPGAGSGGTTGTDGAADPTGAADATATTGGALRPLDATGPWEGALYLDDIRIE